MATSVRRLGGKKLQPSLKAKSTVIVTGDKHVCHFLSSDKSCPLLWDWGPSRIGTVVSEDLERSEVDCGLVHHRHRGPDGGQGGHVLPLAGDDDAVDDGDDNVLIFTGPHLLDKPQNGEPSSLVESGWLVPSQRETVFNNRYNTENKGDHSPPKLLYLFFKSHLEKYDWYRASQKTFQWLSLSLWMHLSFQRG